MQESKKISVKRLLVGEVVGLDVLPYYTARDVLLRTGASEDMLLTSPQTGLAFDPDQEVWDQLQQNQTVFVLPGKGPC
jgi:hypothetical protein